MVVAKKEKKIDISEDKYVKWLSELSKDSGAIVGGKGANLAEIYNSGFPVPPAFCVTAQSFDAFLKKAGIKDKIIEIINKTDVDNTLELEKNSAKIREMVATAEMAEDMQAEIIEAYELLSSESKNEFDNRSKELAFVAVRSSATTEDLAGASFAGQQETFTNIRGAKELINAVKKCFASLYTARAVYYRHKKGFDKANALLSVVIQRMINSDKSGVMFTKNPSTAKDEIIIEAVFGLGEGIVSGKILPDHYVLNTDLEVKEKIIANKKIKMIKEENGNGITIKLDKEESNSPVLSLTEVSTLGSLAQRIEKHYKKAQDIEFAIERGKIFIVQTRPITTLEQALVSNEKNKDKLAGNVLLTGLSASPGLGFGKVKVVLDMKDLNKVQEGDILVTKMTNPDMVVTMQKATGVITDEGGATSHAAIVSREMGIPCIVGTEKATELLKDGQEVTVDGTNGKVYAGRPKKIELTEKKEIQQIVKTQTKIKVMVDLPHFAERAAKSGCSAVGLMRLEGIIAESGKHPMGFLKDNKADEYSLIIEKGIREISKHFKEIWIRTSDIRTDEYKNLRGAPKEVELNPMLGFHGIRFSLKNLGIFEAELQAIANIASEFPEKKFGVMFPQIINLNEIEESFKIFKKYHKKNMIMGAMIETPAAVQIIRDICKYVKFISFGTNDLTQYTLAVDRGNSECQYLYNEMHPAVLSQLKRVISICKEYKVETSICGQAGSKKEMVEYLVKHGIDSISVNADMAREISLFVAELEKNLNSDSSHQSMTNKSKILPIDDTKEIQEDIKESKEEILQDKIKKENQNKDTLEITKETPKEQADKEFPEFELGFDPFQQQ